MGSTKSRWNCLLLTLFVSGVWQSIQAQDPVRYRPARPTVSPYLNLLRNDSGAMPNYYSLVRPQLDEQAAIRRQGAVNQRQSLSIQRLTDVTAAQAGGPTGSHSVYRNYSHYYSKLGSRNR